MKRSIPNPVDKKGFHAQPEPHAHSFIFTGARAKIKLLPARRTGPFAVLLPRTPLERTTPVGLISEVFPGGIHNETYRQQVRSSCLDNSGSRRIRRTATRPGANL